MKRGLATRLRFGPIDALTYNRMSHLGHVNSDLMRSSGFEPKGNQRRDGSETLDDSEVRDRVPTFPWFACDTPS